MDNIAGQGLLFKATLTIIASTYICVNHSDSKVYKDVESVHCVILCDTTQNSQGETPQISKPTNAKKAVSCKDLLPGYNEWNVTMKICGVISNIYVDASCLHAALN